MKTVTTQLANLLSSRRQFAKCDLFTITRRNGAVLRIASADVPVYWDGEIYSCYSVQASGLRYRIVTGIEADEQTLTLACDRTVMLDNLPFLDAVQQGALDGAKIKRERAFFEAWETPCVSGLVPAGCITLFTGYASSVENVTRTEAELKVKSNLALLDMNMPRNTWQGSCINTLYDDWCGISKQSKGISGQAEAGSTDIAVKWSNATAATYWKGTVDFVSGANAGQTRTIKNSDGAHLIFATPLPYIVDEGDAFIAYPGCDHTTTTCTLKGNLPRIRCFPYIPTAETAL
ncbi:MAG: DUF2163 domain-containing protein [Chlorobiaceae bacterium]|nr:DUF2163 domain-containing protein [Chlorobiaceae bacterium]